VANSLLPIVRTESYLYRKHPQDSSPEGKLLQYTARDDWGQDATLQDPGWAYLERFFAASLPAALKLDSVVTHAWLTRAGGTIYPKPDPATFNLTPSTWVLPGTRDCGDGTTCNIYQEGDSLYLFLNAMDALDRFVTLFMLDPVTYPLSTICIPSCTGKQCGDDGCGGSCGSCVQPPAASCIDASTLRHYASPGTCTVGQCSYAPTDTLCPNGCQNALCVNCTPSCGGKQCGDDGCGGSCGTCSQPPAKACLDPSTLRYYPTPGTCSAGACSYVPVDTPCPLGCKDTVCLGCTPSCSGKPCGSDDGCGGSCGACPDLGPDRGADGGAPDSGLDASRPSANLSGGCQLEPAPAAARGLATVGLLVAGLVLASLRRRAAAGARSSAAAGSACPACRGRLAACSARGRRR